LFELHSEMSDEAFNTFSLLLGRQAKGSWARARQWGLSPELLLPPRSDALAHVPVGIEVIGLLS